MLLVLERRLVDGGGALNRSRGQRWSARSEARTNDLDADEERRMLVPSSRSVVAAGGRGDRSSVPDRRRVQQPVSSGAGHSYAATGRHEVVRP
jgi:hypothetical protein